MTITEKSCMRGFVWDEETNGCVFWAKKQGFKPMGGKDAPKPPKNLTNVQRMLASQKIVDELLVNETKPIPLKYYKPDPISGLCPASSVNNPCATLYNCPTDQIPNAFGDGCVHCKDDKDCQADNTAKILAGAVSGMCHSNGWWAGIDCGNIEGCCACSDVHFDLTNVCDNFPWSNNDCDGTGQVYRASQVAFCTNKALSNSKESSIFATEEDGPKKTTSYCDVKSTKDNKSVFLTPCTNDSDCGVGGSCTTVTNCDIGGAVCKNPSPVAGDFLDWFEDYILESAAFALIL
jgi:hypothetical protein